MHAPSKKIEKKRKQADLPLFDRLVLVFLLLFLFSDVMGGAIRYFAIGFGLPWLPYFPQIFLALALLPMFFVYMTSEAVTPTLFTVFALFAISATFGLFNLANSGQVEFGLWVLVPFLFGIVALPSLIRGWNRLTPYAVFLWALAVAGVLLNFFYSWPWIGLQYQIGATTVIASRAWQVGSLHIARLPGFSEASYFVAPQILLLALFLREMLPKWRITMWVVSGVALVLTTSKTPLVIFILFSILWPFSRGAVRRSWRWIPLAAATLDILLPFSMLLVRRDWLAYIHSKFWAAAAASLFERMQEGWPAWIRMVVAHGNLFLGRGLGGIGTAQQHFEPALFSPADNMAVYLYATFGVLGLLLLLYYGRKATGGPTNSPIGRFFFLTACALTLAGLTTTVMDGTIAGIAFGASLRYLQEGPILLRRRAPEPRTRPANAKATADSSMACA